MDTATAAIIGTSVTAVVTIVGWNVSHILAKKREDDTRRLEKELRHIQQQIEEFYGPLFNLIEQIFNVWTVRENVLFPGGRPDDMAGTDLRRDKIPAFIQECYFFPLHEKIGAILISKLYLVDAVTVPDSFKQYLEHSTQQIVQHRLWKELNVSTDNVPGVPWPDEFYDDIRNALESLMNRQDRLLKKLHGARKPNPSNSNEQSVA
jgi:hypothetical protein